MDTAMETIMEDTKELLQSKEEFANQDVMGRSRNYTRHLVGPYPGSQGIANLDDPVTQVATVRTTEERVSSAPKYGRFISSASASPSPPLIKSGSYALMNRNCPSNPSMTDSMENTSQDDKKAEIGGILDPTNSLNNQNAPNRSSVQNESGSKTPPFEPEVRSTITKADLIAFVEILEKKVQRDESLPSSIRFTSRRSCRFELPCDMKTLEKLEPLTYLIQCCRVTPLKAALYLKTFRRICKLNLEKTLKPGALSGAFSDIFCRKISDTDIENLTNMVTWDRNYTFDEISFVAITALMERILSSENRNTSLDSLDKRDDIESLDFSALPTKLERINVSPELKKLLLYIADS